MKVSFGSKEKNPIAIEWTEMEDGVFYNSNSYPKGDLFYKRSNDLYYIGLNGEMPFLIQKQGSGRIDLFTKCPKGTSVTFEQE